MKVVVNPDKEHVRLVREALRQTGGYCPCMIEKSEDTKCMCRDFREQKTEGFCHCGLYEKCE